MIFYTCLIRPEKNIMRLNRKTRNNNIRSKTNIKHDNQTRQKLHQIKSEFALPGHFPPHFLCIAVLETVVRIILFGSVGLKQITTLIKRTARLVKTTQAQISPFNLIIIFEHFLLAETAKIMTSHLLSIILMQNLLERK